MKIAIVGWRPWTVTQRYRSLIVNAKRLGHQVFGVVTEHYGDGPTTMSLFKDLGVPAAMLSLATLDRFDPDVVLGECFWGQGITAVRWAQSRGKEYFALDHSKVIGGGEFAPTSPKPQRQIVFLAANEVNANILTQRYGTPAFAVGFPNFDVDYQVDVDEVRTNLGVTNQPMIALFLAAIHTKTVRIEDEEKRLFPFLALVAEKGWKVFVHLQPEEQLKKYRLMDNGCPRHKFLTALQDRGAVLVSDIPGNFNGLIFQSCGPMALTRSADLVGGTYHDRGSAVFGAYAASKKYFRITDANYQDIIKAIEEKNGSIVQDPDYVRRWFHKLDGQCWRRILDAIRT